MTKKGIDVSKWQGDIDWSKVRSDGIEFAIIRIGYGKYEEQKDNKFEKNYESAKENGIAVGVYLYSYATTVEAANQEADCVLKWLNNRSLDLPIYYDLEDSCQNNISKSVLTDICETFCQKIEKSGYWVGIYSSKFFLTNKLDYKRLENKYTIWVAQYNNKNTYKGKYDMWQYSSSGSVNGIAGNVDMNYLYRDVGGKIVSVTDKVKENSNYQGNSLVDYLKSIGVDSSYENRKKLALENGIDNYSGTAEQNLNLLNKLRNIDNTGTIYIVKSGDNLSKIASKYGTTWKKLYEDNKDVIGNNPNLIHVGTKIVIK